MILGIGEILAEIWSLYQCRFSLKKKKKKGFKKEKEVSRKKKKGREGRREPQLDPFHNVQQCIRDEPFEFLRQKNTLYRLNG